MSGPDLSNYEEVPDRIVKFFAKYPEGSLQCENVEYRELPAAHLNGEPCLHIIYHALAYRSPEDPKPGHGKASEPVPGLTPYTKGSELMNAETSAWGRALVALGFVGKKVASANEVRARQEGDGSRRQPDGSPKPSEKQRALISAISGQKKLLKKQIEIMASELVGSPVEVKEGWVAEYLTGGREGTASQLIDRLSKGPYPDVAESVTPVSDVSSDASGFVHPQSEEEGDTPWAPQAA